MTRIAFVASLLTSLLGICLMAVSLLTSALLPKAGRAVFMLRGGTYNPSDWEGGVALQSLTILGLTCVISGFVSARRVYFGPPDLTAEESR